MSRASHEGPTALRRPRDRGPRKRLVSLLFGLGGALGLAGCGHPATVDECNTIIAKSAELELRAQNVSDPAIIAQRIEAVKTARGDELLKRCVGKRITERAVACVAKAQTPVEVDKCLE